MATDPTVFVRIGAAMAALLQADPPIAEGRVWRGRQSPIAQQTPSAVVIRIEKSAGQRADVADGPIDWATDYQIELYARVASGEPPEDTVDPLLREAFARLSGAGPALGLAVEDILLDPRIAWDYAEGSTPQVVATLSVRVIHRTKANGLDPWT